MQKSIVLLITLSILSASLAYAATVSDQVQKPVKTAIDTYQNTQKERELWLKEKEKLIVEYETLLKTRDDLTRRKKELMRQNQASHERIEKKEKKMVQMQQITTQIDPFIGEILKRLDQLVLKDTPFLKDERRQRMQKLHSLVNDPEISISDRFRKVTEALFVEAEYGQTIEVYQETISMQGSERLVNILRLGRICLFFQSLDQTICGHYNVAQKKWMPLPEEYNQELEAAIEMGAKRKPIEILTLPIGRISAP